MQAVWNASESYPGGGAVMVIRRVRAGDYTFVNITGSSFIGNYAFGEGGAVQLSSTMQSVALLTLTLERSVFEGNSANSAGGALMMYSVNRRVCRSYSDPTNDVLGGQASVQVALRFHP